MSAPLLIDCGGYRTMVKPDKYPSGRECYLAYHPDLEGAFGWGESAQSAVDMLSTVRRAIIAHALERGR